MISDLPGSSMSRKFGLDGNSVNPGISSEASIEVPTSRELLSSDIWKLGCVFTEMVSFLVEGGSHGVTLFRRHITTTEARATSDEINDTRFDDGEQVKSQVLDWLGYLSSRDPKAKLLEPVLTKMLSASSNRPAARDVCMELIAVCSLLYSGPWAGCTQRQWGG